MSQSNGVGVGELFGAVPVGLSGSLTWRDGDLMGPANTSLASLVGMNVAPSECADALIAKARRRLDDVRRELAQMPALQREEKQLEAMLAAAEGAK